MCTYNCVVKIHEFSIFFALFHQKASIPYIHFLRAQVTLVERKELRNGFMFVLISNVIFSTTIRQEGEIWTGGIR